MITFPNGGRLVQSLDELPDLRGAKSLYLDFETTSGDPGEDSLSPWHDCHVAGFALTIDDVEGAWYVPTGHHYAGSNLPLDAVVDWLNEVEDSAECWVNHNVKYDMHVNTNSYGLVFTGRVVCTVTQAKIIDSDRLRYALDVLAKDWLGEDMSRAYEAMRPWLHKNKDYGAIPADLMADYACGDVLTNRRLYKYIREQMPEQCEFVSSVEEKMTRVLYDVERRGLSVDLQELQIRHMQILGQLISIDERLEKLTGVSFRPHVAEDCYQILCNQFGLPVLGWNRPKNKESAATPSFDKHAMAQYAAHPTAPKDIVELIIAFRKLHTLMNFFVVPYQNQQICGLMHCWYNQCVRTFRMSCSDPNMQQLSKEAKKLVHPRAGYGFISCDYSQIEFRYMVHYIDDQECIRAYRENPDTDFHTWVAEMCEIHRKPAKTINFLMGFGGGKAKLLMALESNMELVGTLMDEVDALIEKGELPPEKRHESFKLFAKKRAEKVYDTYHGKLPGIKRTSRAACNTARMRGYVFNMAGRRRHLPQERAHIAFNTLNQSSAADLLKERTVALHEMLRGTDVHIVASVHDETLLECPLEYLEDERLHRDIVGLLEDPAFPLSVPVRCGIGWSTKSWYEASLSDEDAKKAGLPERPGWSHSLRYDKSECQQLTWMK